MTVSDSTKGLDCFFKELGTSFVEAGRNLAANVFKSPGWALQITSSIATAAATKNPKNVLLTLPEAISFYHTDKQLYLGNFV